MLICWLGWTSAHALLAQRSEGLAVTDTTIEKALVACNTEGFGTDTIKADSATDAQYSKAVATQIAVLALVGHAVHPLRCGDFLVCKYGYSHYAQDFDALQSFARKLGVNE